jgi:single-strand DNA-binding protein
MPVSVNKVILAGNLTRDPQVRTISGDKAVAQFDLAINHRYKSASGEMKEDVTFISCEAWGRTAELVGQYLTKGRACLVEGRLKLDSWDDKDGQKRQKLKVVANGVQFLDSVAKGEGAANSQPAPARSAAVAGAGADEPPFARSELERA